jgi:hypothetical protein
VREDPRKVHSKKDATALGHGAPPTHASGPRSAAHASQQSGQAPFDIHAEELSHHAVPERPRFGQSMMEANRRGSSRWIWIAIVLIILGAGAVAALYFAGIIK